MSVAKCHPLRPLAFGLGLGVSTFLFHPALHAQVNEASVPLTEAEEEELQVLPEFAADNTLTGAMVVPSSKQSEAVFGFALDVANTPRNISFITAEQIEIFDITNVEDFGRFSSGISTVTSFGDQATPFIRGDLSEAYVNGIRKFFQQSAGPVNFNGLEGIQVVKGPAPSNLGPTNYTGGFVNYTTKRPYFDAFQGSIKTRFGEWTPRDDSFFRNETTFDFGGPLSDETAYRFSFTGTYNEGFYDFVDSESIAAYGAISHKLTDAITIDFFVDAYYVEWVPYSGINRPTQALVDDFIYTGGATVGLVPGVTSPFGFGANLPSANVNLVQIDNTANLGSDGDQGRGTNVTTQLLVTNQINPSWRLKNITSFEYNRYKEFFEYAYTEYVPRDFIFEERLEFLGSFEKLGIEQRTSTGAAFRYQFNESYHFLFEEQFNVFDVSAGPAIDPGPFPGAVPVPGSPFVAEPGGGAFGQNPATSTDFITTIGAFHTHEADINDWLTLVASGRLDWAYAEIENPLITGTAPLNNQNNDELLWNFAASAIFKPREDTNVYVTFQSNKSYLANIFTGGLQYDTNSQLGDELFDARSELIEVGVKFTVDEKLFISGAAYYQERTRQNRSFAQDNLEVRGLEAELSYQPSEFFWLTANYTFLDAELVDFNPVGNILTLPAFAPDIPLDDLGLLSPPGTFATDTYNHPGLPSHYLNIYALFAFQNGIGLAGGFQYQDSYNLDLFGSVKIPAQFVVNATLYYEWENWRFQIEGQNLTDERIFNPNLPIVSGGSLVSVGLPRRFSFSVAYNF